MAHMEQEITVKQRGWKVETRDAGTCFVPGDVVSAEDFYAIGVPICRVDSGDVFELLKKRLQDYVEGADFEEIEVVEGYFGRWSAPGYLDASEWTYGKTLREIKDALVEWK